MGKQVRVTLSDGEMEFINKIAARMGTTESDVVQLGFRLGAGNLRSMIDTLRSLEPKSDWESSNQE